MAQVWVVFICHPIHMRSWCVRCSFDFDLPYLQHFLPHFFHFLEGRSKPVHSAEKGMDSLDETYSLTGYDPNAYDFKETYVESYTESLTSPPFLQARVSWGRRVRWHRTRGYATWSSPSTCLSLPARRLVCRSVVVCVRKSGATCWRPNGATCWTNSQELNVANAQIKTLLDRQKERILAECHAEITRHEFQADYDRRSVRKLGEIIESQQEELHCAQVEELQQRDQQLLHERLLQQNLELREAHQKSLNEMEVPPSTLLQDED